MIYDQTLYEEFDGDLASKDISYPKASEKKYHQIFHI